MSFNGVTIQDLMDLIHISHERVITYNKNAYQCENLQLKMLLNQETDQARDSILGIKKLLHERFNIESEYVTTGPLYSIWSEFKPSFTTTEVNTLLLDLEMADLLTLQCYCSAITRPLMDSISRNLLEFQYQNNLMTYYSMKGFRNSYCRKRESVTNYSCLQSA